jgi:hypothetical protein
MNTRASKQITTHLVAVHGEDAGVDAALAGDLAVRVEGALALAVHL